MTDVDGDVVAWRYHHDLVAKDLWCHEVAATFRPAPFVKDAQALVLKSTLEASRAETEAARRERDEALAQVDFWKDHCENVVGKWCSVWHARANELGPALDAANARAAAAEAKLSEMTEAGLAVGDHLDGTAVELVRVRAKLADALAAPQNEALARIHKRRADETSAKLTSLAEIAAPFAAIRDQALSQTARLIDKRFDTLAPVALTVSKGQMLALVAILAEIEEGKSP